MFYVNLGGGRFMDISGTTGLNYTEDGRAFVWLDLDQDGDLDLILKNRNGPQVRILRNDIRNGNRSIAFRLTGTQSNRDAVGALVTLQTPSGRRVKQVTLTSGFLSQPTRDLYFGLGRQDQVDSILIEWPSGLRQTFENLKAGYRYSIVEGQPHFQADPFHPRTDTPPDCPPLPAVPVGAPPEGNSLLIRAAIPPFALKTLQGAPVTRNSLIGQPTVLNLWATWCVPCQTEMKLWKQHYNQILGAGARLVALSMDEPGDRLLVEKFVGERNLPFPIWLANERFRETLNTFYKLLFARAGDIQIPTTFLLDDQAHVVKIYHGIVPVKVLFTDLEKIRNSPGSFQLAALPFPGRRLLRPFFRDYYTLAANFHENGRLREAAFYLEEFLKSFPNDARSWDKLGTIYARGGQLQRGLQALEKAVAVNPNHSESQYDLGVAYMRANQPVKAELSFHRANGLDPGNLRYKLMLDLAALRNGRPGDPVRILEDYLEKEPNDVGAQINLGTAYLQRGNLTPAINRFREASRTDPNNALAFRNLGLAFLLEGSTLKSINALEQSSILAPQDTVTLLALADAYNRIDRKDSAKDMLMKILEIDPSDTRALKLLASLERSP